MIHPSMDVNMLHYWPGESNLAYLGTKGLAESQDMVEGSHWQDGPENTRHQVEHWPISRNFIHAISDEERWADIYGVHSSLKTKRTEGSTNRDGPSEMELEDLQTMFKL